MRRAKFQGWTRGTRALSAGLLLFAGLGVGVVTAASTAASASPGATAPYDAAPVSGAALSYTPVAITLTPADESGLVQAFVDGYGQRPYGYLPDPAITPADIAMPIPTPQAAYVSADNSDWVYASFELSPIGVQSYDLQVGFQDGGNAGFFVRPAGSGPDAWTFVATAELPGGCVAEDVLPAALLWFWNLNDCGRAVGIAAEPDGDGYQTVGQPGGISNFGTTNGATGTASDAPVVGIATTPSGNGNWVVAADGGVFASGDAGFYGSAGDLALNQPIVGIAPTPDGRGYWLVASDGGVLSYGDAAFYGSMGGTQLNQPIVGIASTPDGKGYWLVASDGGIFSFGDATFGGSLGNLTLNAPIVGMTPDPSGGYWLVAADGGIFALGGAPFLGSGGPAGQAGPVTAMAATPDGGGYWLVRSNNAVSAFGDAQTFGCADGNLNTELCFDPYPPQG